MQPTTSLPRPSDRWIPWYIVGFFVALIIILVPMGILAVRTNTGVVTDSAYEKGLAYNKSIAAAEQQAALKWRGKLVFTPLATGAIAADFQLMDAGKKPIDNAVVKIWFVRPTQDGMDQALAMTPQAEGHYRADASLPVPGQWEARVSATSDGKNYQITQRIILP